MKVLLSWVREFAEVTGTAEEIGTRMSMRGLPLEGIESVGDDAVLDFEVTSNRPDCLSIVGVAREIATAFSVPMRASALSAVASAKAEARATADTIPVTIDEPDLCSRYVAAVAEVTIGPSPAWMRDRLAACGVRPINNVVDATNYVLLELGHPMHAFDLDKLAGPAIVVRRARPNESIRTLDGKTRALAADMLVIADAERASAIGGVMGGGDAEVSTTTRRIVLESAWFKPQSIRSTSKRLGLRTEASYRFERGADRSAPPVAMERALALLHDIGALQSRGPLIDVYPVPHTPVMLSLDAKSIRGLLGMDVPITEVERILRSLGFDVTPLGGWQAGLGDAATPVGAIGQSWRVGVPAWRVDVHRQVDLIEEVGRQHGFEHLPATFPAVDQAPPPSDPRIARDARARRTLLAMGFSEAITFAFIESEAAARFAEGDRPVALANPLSEKFSTLRPSLLPGLLDAVSHNRRHGRRDVRLFEIGTRFSRAGEVRAAAAVWTGMATPDHWGGDRRTVDFFDVKGAVEQLGAAFGLDPTVHPTNTTYLVDGQRADVRIGNERAGVLGRLDPRIAERHGLPAEDAIFLLELSLDVIAAQQPQTVRFARPLPRHPAIVRDVAILIDEGLSAETVRGTIRTASPALLVDIREFDRYQGKGIASGKISLAFRLTFQAPDRTLTDEEVQAAMQRIVSALTTELGAQQR